MSDRFFLLFFFQRVRPGSLPSLPFSFFNSSCLCPSCKLPLSPWGWGKAVSLFPSQTSVSINSCARHLLLLGLGLGLGEEVLCLSGGVGFLAPLGLASVGWLQPWTREPWAGGQGSGGPVSGGQGGCPAQSYSRSQLCFAGWVALDRFLNLSEPLLPPP